MGHATELITLDVYGDNREIIADCVDEIQPFIDEVLPIKEVDKQFEEELLEIEVPAKIKGSSSFNQISIWFSK